MSTIFPRPDGYPSEIIGYAEPWIVSPGDTVDIKVSCTEPEYKYRLVRYSQGYEEPKSPRRQVEDVAGVPAGTRQGRFQLAPSGSYGLVEDIGTTSEDEGVKFSFYVQPWMITDDHSQTIISTLDGAKQTGFSINLNPEGLFELWVGLGSSVQVIPTKFLPRLQRWVHVGGEILGNSVKLAFTPQSRATEPAPTPSQFAVELAGPVKLSGGESLLIAASRVASPKPGAGQSRTPSNHFNGRLDTVVLATIGRNPRKLAHYDFSVGIPTDEITDISGNSRNGILVNAPTRAMKGFDWDGTELDWTRAKKGYGAIHFHEDDLDDACWATDFSLKVPNDARSGVYSVEIQATETDVRESIVFYVRPTPTTTAKTAMVLGTFTYLAYANEHMWDQNSPARAEVPDEFGSFKFYEDETLYKQQRRKDLGLSQYDVHRDGTGVVYSSAKRPLLNNRPDYVNWTGHRPRELSADLIMIGFLERLGIPYDVVTDHDLHLQGVEMLSPYSTLITGCHPEYPSLQSYMAYEDFVKKGGNLMYLGGNGFYWTSTTDPARPHRSEVRRGGQGVRTSYQEPGERHHSTDGRMGGLWRDNGRAANYLVGIGCCGEGAGPGVPYKRTDISSSHPELCAWLFKDIPDGALIGENTLGGFGGGASADEIDRLDYKYGSPANAVVVASSIGHSDRFGLFPEDSGFPMMKTLGSQTDMIRSDMTYYQTSGGGAVFSVGSISWYVGLGYNDYDNNVATLTANVLRNFTKS
ncbi:hypothetical protein A1O1_05069 [Capronia coronata CBS 617.96]|uniref:N,N-dimethylformamidase beta subunit-like C-terminal domain-containing protein n=1 Tax=Capronia coronata CBS 617.96 TaxID=1182541 RepID=W9YFV5_9EURO|nr:uncharacterized protein A1O1_05069 [Capronia coronata CBS 617.96]EXJ88141.1 hypothetical protein A1O1_05069 [Capronia coronata CBS 617.96]